MTPVELSRPSAAEWSRRVRGAWGTLLLAFPRALLALGGGDRSPPVVIAVRVLGARHLTESLLMAARHEERPPNWMIEVDAVHAASMLVLAARSPRLRRDALASAGTAVLLIGLSFGERRGGLRV
jgi:hypothetical protein